MGGLSVAGADCRRSGVFVGLALGLGVGAARKLGGADTYLSLIVLAMVMPFVNRLSEVTSVTIGAD